MSGVSTIGEAFLIPRDILSKDEQAVYDMVPEAERKIRYKWWSMHDLMKYYHNGLLTLENDANIFAFRIDLTAPELTQNKFRDSGLGTGLDTAMMSLNDVTNAISQVITGTREKLITQQQETTMNATMRRGGKKKGKKTQKGGVFDIVPSFIDPAFTPSEAFSAKKLKNECMNDLEKDIFNSRNRIFVVDGKLPTYTAPGLEVLTAAEKQLEDELKANVAANPNMPPMPPQAIPLPGIAPSVSVGGRRRKTRKLRNKKSKRGKTRRA